MSLAPTSPVEVVLIAVLASLAVGVVLVRHMGARGLDAALAIATVAIGGGGLTVLLLIDWLP